MSKTKQTNKNHLPAWLLNNLPTFNSATHITQRFDDSTHELWLLESSASSSFLKICSNTSSPFWQIMQSLFDFDLPQQIGNFAQLYRFIDAATPLQIPTIVTAVSAQQKDNSSYHNAYIVSSLVTGEAVDKPNLIMVEQLAEHIAGLHQHTFTSWGCFYGSPNNKQWPETLVHILQDFSAQQTIPTEYLAEAIDACQHIETAEFVPIMPDLRWDQFLQEDGELTALVDLDAFVSAPRELDFVLLEYLLSAEHYAHFCQCYSTVLTIPDISEVRPAYRLLLFLMQVLGETDIDTWMNADCL